MKRDILANVSLRKVISVLVIEISEILVIYLIFGAWDLVFAINRRIQIYSISEPKSS